MIVLEVQAEQLRQLGSLSGWLTTWHHSPGNRIRLKKTVNIPAGTLKIGLLGSDAQTAKEDTVISFSGAVKAIRN